MPTPSARDRFLEHLRAAVIGGTLVKLTLGKHRGADRTLRNLHVRPVVLKTGPRLAFTWRHQSRDLTKNHTPEEALALLDPLVGGDFHDAHLFTTAETVQFAAQTGGSGRLKVQPAVPGSDGAKPAPGRSHHDRPKAHRIPATAPWLRALGVTNEQGQPVKGMAAKFRQIQKFAEVVTHLLSASGIDPGGGLRIVDMGSGKGYLTFALASILGPDARITGIDTRTELVNLCNRVAGAHDLAPRLSFAEGTIATAPLDEGCDVLIALHACDTATDDALARGLSAGARLLLVAPCCQQELRPQLTAPPVLAGPLRHGIFQERQAEFVTDALRALLLEWAGCRTRVFEFVSTEHTARNLMIAALRPAPPAPPTAERLAAVRELARFYGIRTQALARHLGVDLAP